MAWTHEQPQPAAANGTVLPSNVNAEANGRKNLLARGSQVLDVAPKVVDACSVRGAISAHAVRQTVTDVVEYFISPMSAVGSTARRADRQRKKKMADRVTEFRLCVDMVEDCMDAYSSSHERDILSTAEETLGALNDLLMRIAELTFMHRAAALASSRDTEAAELLQVLQSPEFDPADFTQHLLDSGLGISGLLEACLGELTDWLVSPTQEERITWEHWDRTYRHIYHQACQAELEMAANEAWNEPFVVEVCCENPNLKCGQTVQSGDQVTNKLEGRHLCGTLLLPKMCEPEPTRSAEDDIQLQSSAH
mmetsp:Transcript_57582/g.100764  ORF Transcript_57582/g.100764 Transcript_57582/m.100764 type:complete len:308 (+) Transcript_57582:91-1014(+)